MSRIQSSSPKSDASHHSNASRPHRYSQEPDLGTQKAVQSATQNDITVVPDRDPKLGRIWRLTATQHLSCPLEEVFPFFADAYNLERLTPSFLKFRVLTPRPIEMKPGCIIRYQLKVRGVPIKWKTSILDWDPPHRFIDNQDSGPYALWHHTHNFEPTPDGSGTICTDVVRYRPAGWILAPIVNKILVQRDVVNIFRYRFRMLEKIFTPNR